MHKAFSELQQILKNSGLPEYPSLLPRELRTQKIEEKMAVLHQKVLTDVCENQEAIDCLVDYIGIPLEVDLDKISEILKGEESIECGEEMGTKSEGNPYGDDCDVTGFKTARGGVPNMKRVKGCRSGASMNGSSATYSKTLSENEIDEESNIEMNIIERIKSEILEKKVDTHWDDVVGLSDVKKNINEIVLWPMQRPDIFKGLRGPPKGLLLFGPPGTGKTLIGKCIASQVNATFFSISASSLTSKWVGVGEKMVRALFFLARKMQPSVIFVDEIDSLLSHRTESENEGSRRIKTEFLVQFDGVGTSENDRILLIGATNRPQEIDEAARRRLVKRIYVPLPDRSSRKIMVKKLIGEFTNNISDEDMDKIADCTDGYSGSDMFNLCREASLEPLREISDISKFESDKTRPITLDDFKAATKQIRGSVSQGDLDGYRLWNDKFGSISQLV